MVESEKIGLYNRYKNNEIQKQNLSADDWDRIAYGINLLKDAPIYIASDVPYSIDDICINSTRFKKEKNIEAIIIDYLQLICYQNQQLFYLYHFHCRIHQLQVLFLHSPNLYF